jgi:predicted alpha/beta superfamily hydrolase
MMRPLRLLLALIAVSVAHAQSPASSPPGRPIVIGRIDSLWSPTLKEWRQIWIYTPPSYTDTGYTPARYPVLYLLDGNAHFHSVSGLVQILGTGVNGTFVVPEMIVVAIPNTDRTRDLTPTHAEVDAGGKPTAAFRTSGGGSNFLRFIRTELIPHVDSAYRTAPYRVLVGHSFGGIATIDALYTMPETFNAYVAIDPSLWWDHRVLLRQATDYFKRARLTGRSLFVGQANTLSPDDTTDNAHYSSIVRFNSIVQRYRSPALRYAYKYYPDDSHGSVPLAAEYDALRFIFADYNVDLRRAVSEPTYVESHFNKLASSLGYDIQPSERLLSQFAQIAFQSDTNTTFALVALDARLYPRSARAQNLLGDVLVIKGDRDGAIAAYERVLVLRPGDKHAEEGLRKLRGM